MNIDDAAWSSQSWYVYNQLMCMIVYLAWRFISGTSTYSVYTFILTSNYQICRVDCLDKMQGY